MATNLEKLAAAAEQARRTDQSVSGTLRDEEAARANLEAASDRRKAAEAKHEVSLTALHEAAVSALGLARNLKLSEDLDDLDECSCNTCVLERSL